MISLSGIYRTFPVGDEQVAALQNVHLTIQQGEYLVIMGPSVSGKSTLLNISGLLDRPDQGTYLLEQQDITALSDQEQAEVRRHKIGFVFQSFHLIPRMTAAENVELPMLLAGIETAERKKRVAEELE